jgi:hypothetical protein
LSGSYTQHQNENATRENPFHVGRLVGFTRLASFTNQTKFHPKRQCAS